MREGIYNLLEDIRAWLFIFWPTISVILFFILINLVIDF
jgi:hypothetical protein